jgi:polyferredoxin
MVDKIKKIIPKNITEQQKKDTGLALTLLFLIIGLFTNNILFFKMTIPIILITMLIPSLLYPFAIFWFGLANFLGFFVSKIVLSIIFIILIVPLGLIRRLFGKDSLQLKQFKVSKKSILINKNHTYTRKDILKPF